MASAFAWSASAFACSVSLPASAAACSAASASCSACPAAFSASSSPAGWRQGPPLSQPLLRELLVQRRPPDQHGSGPVALVALGLHSSTSCSVASSSPACCRAPASCWRVPAACWRAPAPCRRGRTGSSAPRSTGRRRRSPARRSARSIRSGASPAPDRGRRSAGSPPSCGPVVDSAAGFPGRGAVVRVDGRHRVIVAKAAGVAIVRARVFVPCLHAHALDSAKPRFARSMDVAICAGCRQGVSARARRRADRRGCGAHRRRGRCQRQFPCAESLQRLMRAHGDQGRRGGYAYAGDVNAHELKQASGHGSLARAGTTPVPRARTHLARRRSWVTMRSCRQRVRTPAPRRRMRPEVEPCWPTHERHAVGTIGFEAVGEVGDPRR